MRITRRHLAVAGALALGGLGLLRSSSSVAESADEAAVAQAVEALRKAIFGQDKTQLEALAADQLSYGHSDGRVQNKAEFIEGVMTRKAIVKSITLSDHTITVVGNDAIAKDANSIRQIYGSIGMTETDFTLLLVARTATAADAKNLSDTVMGLKQLGGILIARMAPAKKNLAQSALDSLKITTRANELEIRTQFAATDLSAFLK